MKNSTRKDIPQSPEAENRTTTLPKIRTAAYCRAFDDNPIYGCQAQASRFTEQINSNPNWDMAGIYTDVGGTSMPTSRPAFRRLLNDCRSGKIEKILVLSLSRFARRIAECQEVLRELDTLGVSVRFEKEDIDTADIEGRHLLDVMFNCMAQIESEKLPMGICSCKFTHLMKPGRRKGARNYDGNDTKSYHYPCKT